MDSAFYVQNGCQYQMQHGVTVLQLVNAIHYQIKLTQQITLARNVIHALSLIYLELLVFLLLMIHLLVTYTLSKLDTVQESLTMVRMRIYILLYQMPQMEMNVKLHVLRTQVVLPQL